MQKTLTSWLLTTLIISLGFGQLLRLELYQVPIYIHDLLVVLILLINWDIGKVNLPKGIKILLLGMIIGWLRAITIYPVATLFVPSLYTWRLLSYLALYLVIQKKAVVINTSSYLIAGSISLVIGIAQYMFMPDMRLFQYLGWDDHLNRLTMPHYDPTFSAAMLAMFFLRSESLIQVSTIFYGLGILLTYSRSIWLSILLTFASVIRKPLYILFGLLLVIASAWALPKKFGEGTNLLRTFSITSRFDADFKYLTKYKFDLLFGRGFNTLLLDNQVSLYSNHATGPNNSYLFLLSTTGVIGLAGWLIFLKELYVKSHYKKMILFVLWASLFNNVMFYPFTLLLLLLSNSNAS